MHCMLMDLLHGFEVLSTTEETLFIYLFFIYSQFYSPIMKKRRGAIRARLRVADHRSTTPRWGNPV